MPESHAKRFAIGKLVDQLMATCTDNQAVNHEEGHDLPDKQSVEHVLDLLLAILFPGYSQGKAVSPATLPYYFGDLITRIPAGYSVGVTALQVHFAMAAIAKLLLRDSLIFLKDATPLPGNPK